MESKKYVKLDDFTAETVLLFRTVIKNNKMGSLPPTYCPFFNHTRRRHFALFCKFCGYYESYETVVLKSLPS